MQQYIKIKYAQRTQYKIVYVNVYLITQIAH